MAASTILCSQLDLGVRVLVEQSSHTYCVHSKATRCKPRSSRGEEFAASRLHFHTPRAHVMAEAIDYGKLGLFTKPK